MGRALQAWGRDEMGGFVHIQPGLVPDTGHWMSENINIVGKPTYSYYLNNYYLSY